MIRSLRLNYYFVCAPKNATLSVRQWLRQFYEGEVCGGYHQVFINEAQRKNDPFVFLTVRHPVPRLWSWYQWELHQVRRRDPKRMPQFEGRLGCFMDFLEVLIENRGRAHTIPSPQLGLTQYDYFTQSGASKFIKVEHLVSGLASLPFADGETAARIEHQRRTPGKEEMRISPEERREIEAYCPADFDTFGYE